MILVKVYWCDWVGKKVKVLVKIKMVLKKLLR